ncbi:MAG: SUMF1/EgtB/PvdO family nonheme iron enzyme [Gammaproteobacteria bacterium]|nr:SUMF1/EgtB/PvdO family nonheme iron enzyme [Gammaproteobacteria bacterium]
MFNIYVISRRTMLRSLIVLSTLLCIPYCLAQQQDENTVDEWEMDLALPAATAARPGFQNMAKLPDASQEETLQQLLSDLAADSTNTEILTQINTLLADVLDQARTMLDAGQVEEAAQLLAVILPIDPNLPGFQSVQQRVWLAREINGLLEKGNAALEANQLIEPRNSSAYTYFYQALLRDSGNSATIAGLVKLQEALIMRAYLSAQALDFTMSAHWLQQASEVYEDQSQVEEASEQLVLFMDMHVADLETKVLAAIDAGSFSEAHSGINELQALGTEEETIDMLNTRLGNARFYGGFQPGQVIRDEFLQSGAKAPEVVIVAAGSFMMGGVDRAGGTNGNEQPRHRVTLEKGFGLSVVEVTVGQFGEFIQQAGYQTTADRRGSSSIYDEAAGKLIKQSGVNWQSNYLGGKATPGDPVIHVSFADAQAYVRWLAASTGKQYRLPSEAEYEYVARVAGRESYWWGGGSPTGVVENLTGQLDESPGKRTWGTPFENYGDGYWGPAPAGSLKDSSLVHPMGVHDIAGNVAEWVEDCWYADYSDAPADGSAWIDLSNCTRRVVRGGYWGSAPQKSRAAFRVSAAPESTGPVIGIRIARDL